MKLSRQQIDCLLQMLTLTKPTELTCEECAQLLAEFAEQNLPGSSIPESLKHVEDHLELCDHCREEFEALLEALQSS